MPLADAAAGRHAVQRRNRSDPQQDAARPDAGALRDSPHINVSLGAICREVPADFDVTRLVRPSIFHATLPPISLGKFNQRVAINVRKHERRIAVGRYFKTRTNDTRFISEGERRPTGGIEA